MFSGKNMEQLAINSNFSIAMSNYQRVDLQGTGLDFGNASPSLIHEFVLVLSPFT